MKISTRSISNLLRSISTSPRIHILLGIGTGEVCVCHLEAILGWRQAYISQHLMALRKAKVLTSRREGRFVYYRLRDLRVLELIEKTAELTGVQIVRTTIPEGCSCPTCSPTGALIPVESL